VRPPLISPVPAHDTIAAEGLGTVERSVGDPQQRLGTVAVRRHAGDAGGDRHARQFTVAIADAQSAELLTQAVYPPARVFDGGIREDQRQLFATVAAGDIARANVLLQVCADRA
jgi:hypothetical protein